MKLKLSKPSPCHLPGKPLVQSSLLTKGFAAILGMGTCFGLLLTLPAAEDEFVLQQIPPEIYEWYPYDEPVSLEVSDVLVLFGDVDDFGGGVYTCRWQSDREPIETQIVEFAGSDWINFKTRITYRPTAKDVGTRTLTLTVQDPEGHTDT